MLCSLCSNLFSESQQLEQKPQGGTQNMETRTGNSTLDAAIEKQYGTYPQADYIKNALLIIFRELTEFATKIGAFETTSLTVAQARLLFQMRLILYLSPLRDFAHILKDAEQMAIRCAAKAGFGLLSEKLDIEDSLMAVAALVAENSPQPARMILEVLDNAALVDADEQWKIANGGKSFMPVWEYKLHSCVTITYRTE